MPRLQQNLHAARNIALRLHDARIQRNLAISAGNKNSNSLPDTTQPGIGMNATDSEAAVAYRFKHMANRGMSMDDFRQLFQAPSQRQQKQHVRRWDWHLRMFIYSLMSPAALYAFTCLVDVMKSHDKVFLRLINESKEQQEADSKEMSSRTTAADQSLQEEGDDSMDGDERGVVKRLEDRIATMEAQFQMLFKKLEDHRSQQDDRTAEGDIKTSARPDTGAAKAAKPVAPEDALASASRISRTLVRSPSTDT